MRRTTESLAGPLGLALLAATLALGCARERPADDARLGEMLFRSHGCGACHGAGGRGDGPLSATLRAPVPDLTLGDFRHGATEEAVATTIGQGAGAMPPFDHVPLEDRLAMARHVLSLSRRPVVSGELRVRPLAVRATPPGIDATAGYLTLENLGPDDELVALASDAAGRVSLHRSTLDGDVLRMEAVDSLPLPTGGTVVLAPGGLHLMLEELRAPLGPGDTVTVELRFRRHAAIPVELPVWRAVPE